MNCTTILFSPTGGTGKVAEILAGAWGGAGRTIDLTDGGADFDRITMDPQTVPDPRALLRRPGADSCGGASAQDTRGRVPGGAGLRVRQPRL